MAIAFFDISAELALCIFIGFLTDDDRSRYFDITEDGIPADAKVVARMIGKYPQPIRVVFESASVTEGQQFTPRLRVHYQDDVTAIAAV